MSSETIVTALFLIAAVVAAGVLISALFPAIHRTTSTFGAVSHEADTQIRTDFKIVNAFANASNINIWLKNIGSTRIANNELDQSDIFLGDGNNIIRLPLQGHYDPPEGNNFWDPGETLSITILATDYPTLEFSSGDKVYIQIVLSNGVKRDMEFDFP